MPPQKSFHRRIPQSRLEHTRSPRQTNVKAQRPEVKKKDRARRLPKSTKRMAPIPRHCHCSTGEQILDMPVDEGRAELRNKDRELIPRSRPPGFVLWVTRRSVYECCQHARHLTCT